MLCVKCPSWSFDIFFFFENVYLVTAYAACDACGDLCHICALKLCIWSLHMRLVLPVLYHKIQSNILGRNISNLHESLSWEPTPSTIALQISWHYTKSQKNSRWFKLSCSYTDTTTATKKNKNSAAVVWRKVTLVPKVILRYWGLKVFFLWTQKKAPRKACRWPHLKS